MSSCGSVTYGVAKELAQNPKTIVEQVKQIRLEPGECLSSYDVSPLFTSVLIDPALNIIKDLLDKDTTLKERTVMEVSDIILLLEFCLKNTYLSFQDQFYEQVEGAAMGSPVSPIVANLYMEYLEQKVLSTAPHPKFWHRYVDDTFVIHKETNKQGFLQTHQQCWPCYKVHSRGQQGGWVHPLLGHYCQTRSWWYSVHNCVQETHTYWPVFTVGQLP